MEELPKSVTKALRAPIFNLWWPVALLLCLVVAIGTGSLNPSIFGERQEVKAQLEGMVDQVEELYEEMDRVDDQGLPISSTMVFEASETATGQMKVLMDFSASAMNRMLEHQNAYVSELKAVNWFLILDPERLGQDTDWSESEAIISSARVTMSESQELFDTMMSDIRDDIDSLQLDNEAVRRSMKLRFDQSVNKRRPQRERILDLEKLAIDEIEKIIEFLRTDRDAWIIEGGQIAFYENSDIDIFNQHLANVDGFVAEQTQIQRELISESRRMVAEEL